MSYQQTAENPIPSIMNPTIIGIGGTNGSGKDTIGEVLQEEYGFLFISVTDLLRDEARLRNQPIERQVLRDISAEWRRLGGLGVLVDKALEKFYEQDQGGDLKGLVIASLRNPGENDRVHVLGGKVIWTDAEPKVRYDRIQSAKREGREEEDNKSFEQFVADEQVEMTQSGDEATLNLSAVKEKTDFTIENNGNNIDDFKEDVRKFLEQNFNLTR